MDYGPKDRISKNIELDCLGLKTDMNSPEDGALSRCQEEVRSLLAKGDQTNTPNVAKMFAMGVMNGDLDGLEKVMTESGLIEAKPAPTLLDQLFPDPITTADAAQRVRLLEGAKRFLDSPQAKELDARLGQLPPLKLDE